MKGAICITILMLTCVIAKSQFTISEDISQDYGFVQISNTKKTLIVTKCTTNYCDSILPDTTLYYFKGEDSLYFSVIANSSPSKEFITSYPAFIPRIKNFMLGSESSIDSIQLIKNGINVQYFTYPPNFTKKRDCIYYKYSNNSIARLIDNRFTFFNVDINKRITSIRYSYFDKKIYNFKASIKLLNTDEIVFCYSDNKVEKIKYYFFDEKGMSLQYEQLFFFKNGEVESSFLIGSKSKVKLYEQTYLYE